MKPKVGRQATTSSATRFQGGTKTRSARVPNNVAMRDPPRANSSRTRSKGRDAPSSAFFSPGVPFAWIDAGALLLRALINGAGAPLVAVVVDVVLNRLGEDDSGGRRVLHLEPRKISL